MQQNDALEKTLLERDNLRSQVSDIIKDRDDTIKDRDELKKLVGKLRNDIKEAKEQQEIFRRRVDEAQGQDSKQLEIAQEELKTSQEGTKRLEAERDRLIRRIREKDAIVQRLEVEQNKLKEELIEKANTIRGLKKNITDLRSSLESIENLRKDEAQRVQDLEKEQRSKKQNESLMII